MKPCRVAVANKFHFLQTGGCIDTPQSLEICRHPENYEAMVLADIERVGCGMTNCQWMTPGKGYFHACIVNGRRARPRYAWVQGPRCSKCPAGWNYCHDGLCSKDAPTSAPTRIPTANRPTGSPTRFPTKFPTRSKH
jgi:hypothetical protein